MVATHLFVETGQFIICCLVNLWGLDVAFDLLVRQMADPDMWGTDKGNVCLWGHSHTLTHGS